MHDNANLNWSTQRADGTHSEHHAEIAVLQDLREELKLIRLRLGYGNCYDFLRMPTTLKAIERNTRPAKVDLYARHRAALRRRRAR